MSAHTPGPWRLEEGTNLVWGACNPDDTTSRGMGIPVAEAKVELGKTYDWEQSCINARLIAAAPVLLAALKLVMDEKAPAYHDCTDNGEAECAWCIATNAIALATGEAPR